MPILLILIIPLIGLIAGVLALSSGALHIGGLLWIIIPLIVIFLLGSFLSSLSSSYEEPLNATRHLTPLTNGEIKNYDGTKIIYADGYAFQFANKNGSLHWREIDPISNAPLEPWLRAHPGHSWYLGQDKIARDHITMRVNKRKGLH